MKAFVGAAFFFAAIILINVVTFPRNHDAAKVALHKGGFTSVTHVERSWFNLCHDEFAGYNVTGIRNGRVESVLVCANPWSTRSYIR